MIEREVDLFQREYNEFLRLAPLYHVEQNKYIKLVKKRGEAKKEVDKVTARYEEQLNAGAKLPEANRKRKPTKLKDPSEQQVLLEVFVAQETAKQAAKQAAK